jgi:hypothetical protein
VNIDLYVGDHERARRRLEDAWPDLDRLGVMRLQLPRVEMSLLRARTRLAAGDGDPRAARVLGDELLKEGTPWATGLGHLVRASCAAWSGAVEPARVSLQVAETALASAGMRGFTEVARLYRGRLEGGSAGAARSEAARDSLRELGATNPDAIARHLMPFPQG